MKMYPGCPFCGERTGTHCGCPAEFIQFSKGENSRDPAGELRSYGINIDGKWRLVVDYAQQHTEIWERKNNETTDLILKIPHAIVVGVFIDLKDKIPVWITFS